uniref:Uncharacterized protein n=1 Tax=viral metagenome TaxID=1070528 RepID=A0A6H1ZG73_9ZZZZ
MASIADAVVALKRSKGLPTQDVKPSAAPSTARSAEVAAARNRVAPAEQVANAVASANELSALMSSTPEPEPDTSVVEKKDQAIDDLKERLDNLSQVNSSQADKLQKTLDLLQGLSDTVTKKQADANKPVEPPPDVSNLPTEDAIKELARWVARDEIKGIVKQADENWKGILGAFAQQVRSASEVTDQIQVNKAFPRFDWDAHKAAVYEYRSKFPGVRLAEAVAVVAAQTDPNQLLPAEKRAPVTMESRPSMAAASGQPGQPNRTDPDAQKTKVMQEIFGRIRDANRRGATIERNKLAEQLLKAKGIRAPRA